jgi:adenine-specific DNA methylase
MAVNDRPQLLKYDAVMLIKQINMDVCYSYNPYLCLTITAAFKLVRV